MADHKEKSANLTMSITLRQEIELLEKDFLGNDESGDIIKELYSAIEDVELSTPEYIAFKIFKKENFKLFNPYTNKIPLKKVMELIKEGKSIKEYDNPELTQSNDE